MSGDAQIIIEGQASVSTIDFPLWLSRWEKFYKKTFGRKYDFSGIRIPDSDDIFAWLVCMAGDISAEDWLSAGKDPLDFWKYTNKELDDVLDPSFGRDGWGYQYIVRFKANKEADKDLKNISAIKVAKIGINTATLKERLAIGRFFYWDRKMILDVKTVTLSSGSRYSDGHVPHIRRLYSRLNVDECLPCDTSTYLRPRRVVS